MNDIIPIQSLWHVIDAQFITTDLEIDVMAVTVTGCGKTYAIAVSGHKGMRANEFIPALQAACAGMLIAVGADPSAVGAKTHDPAEAEFDTGNQRAN